MNEQKREPPDLIKVLMGPEDEFLDFVGGLIGQMESPPPSKADIVKDALLSALKTYEALARNATLMTKALDAQGYPSSWIALEAKKIEKVRLAIAVCTKRPPTQSQPQPPHNNTREPSPS